MYINDDILYKVLLYRNTNTLVVGDNISYIDNYINKYKFISYHLYNIDYYVLSTMYYIDIQRTTKNNLVNLIKDIIISRAHYNIDNKKKVIILSNFHNLSSIHQQILKNLMSKSYESCVFIVHTDKLTFIDRNVLTQFIIFTLPISVIEDETIPITYNRIIKIVKKQLHKGVVDELRKLSYMYYMNHTHSDELQRLLITNIGTNIYLPNSVKTNIIEDMCRINKYYQHSYRKPIFLEFIIISLCKHLEHYTYNL